MGGHDIFTALILKNSKKEYLNGKTLIEIGSTREVISSQNSSEHFIKFCKENNMFFISIDMDPDCSQNVIFFMKKHNFLNGKAITMKGEDFLKSYDKSIDFIYLDAFDFYHPGHSNYRQYRYEKYLGCQIMNDDKKCHKMHLDCCENMLDKLTDNSLIFFDDVIDKNKKGKAVTAIPFLLQNGFEIINHQYDTMALQKKSY